MSKEKASAALFDQLQKAIESGEGDDIVGKLKVTPWATSSLGGNVTVQNVLAAKGRDAPSRQREAMCSDYCFLVHAIGLDMTSRSLSPLCRK